MFVNKGIINTRFFSYVHHEEFPEKPEYNMEAPPFCLTPCFLANKFQPPRPTPISISFGKAEPTPTAPFFEGVDKGVEGGVHSNYVKPKFDTREIDTKSCLKYFPVKSCIM